MNDVYTPYEAGLRVLLERLGQDHPRYDEALIYQQRLTEAIAAARRYGDTEARRAGRAEIVDRLNALALETLGVSYSALCRPADGDEERPKAAPPLGEAAPVTHVDTGGGAYVAGNVTVQGGDFTGRDRTVGAAPLGPDEVASLRRRLREARENLGLIEDRKSEYVMSTDVPLQLIKAERRLRERIADLERQLGLGPE